MAINDYPILIDVTTGRLIRDINSDVEINPRPFVQGDIYNVKVMAVTPRPGRPIGRVYDFTTLPSSLYVALGDVGERPESGTFTLTYGGDTTTALAYNASTTAVAAALNALASIVSAGGVSVSGEAGGPYQVTFTNAGVRTAISATTGALYPLTQATIYEAREGTVDVSSIQIIALDRQSAALAETFTDLPAASGTVEEIIAGDNVTGQLEVQRVSISPDAYDGTFSLSFGAASTTALAYNIEAVDLQAALVAAGTWGTGVTVSGQFPIWDITFGGTAADKALATIDVSGLKVPIGKQGELALNTAGIEAIVAGAELATTKLEVSAVISAKPATILQVDAAVLNDGIQNAPQTGPTAPTFYTASEVDALLTGYASDADVAAAVAPLEPIYAVAGTDQDFFGGNGVIGAFADDSVLQFSAEANSVYEVTVHPYVTLSTTQVGGIEHSIQWVLPAGASAAGYWCGSYHTASATPSAILWQTPNAMSSTGPIYTDAGSAGSTEIGGAKNTAIITTAGTAGTVKIQLRCSLIVDTEKLTRKAGSYLIARKLDV